MSSLITGDHKIDVLGYCISNSVCKVYDKSYDKLLSYTIKACNHIAYLINSKIYYNYFNVRMYDKFYGRLLKKDKNLEGVIFAIIHDVKLIYPNVKEEEIKDIENLLKIYIPVIFDCCNFLIANQQEDLTNKEKYYYYYNLLTEYFKNTIFKDVADNLYVIDYKKFIPNF